MTVTIENTTTANGTQTDFNFTFPYLDTTDIKVSINGADQATTKYSLLNATTIRFNDSDKPANNDVVRIYRSTSSDNPKATFYAGSVIRAGDLNDNTLQNLYITQEANVDVLNAWKTGDQTIISTETWHTSDDTKVATTKAIEARIDAKIDNISGEVTANSSGVTEVADGKIDLANLKVSNAGSVGQYLQKSSTTEGLTWASGTTVGGAANLDFNDDVKVRFGTGTDFELYHNATNSIIDNSTGTLFLLSDNITFKDKDDGDTYAAFTHDGAVTLYYDNASKLATSNTGVTITGTAVADGFTGNVTGDVTGNAGTFTVSANNSTDETVYPVFVDGATGSQGAETDTGLTYNPSSGLLTSTSFAGALTGDVTGNVSGSAATVTGAAQSAIQSVGTLGSLTVGTGDLVVDTDTLLVDSSEDRVGVNKASPVSALDIVGSVTQSAITPAALEVDCSAGNYFTKTLIGSSTITFANIPAGVVYGFILEITTPASATTITWPDGTGGDGGTVKWTGGSAPTTASSKTHIFNFITSNGNGDSTTWRGSSSLDYTT
jgi:hypothetical protein